MASAHMSAITVSDVHSHKPPSKPNSEPENNRFQALLHKEHLNILDGRGLCKNAVTRRSIHNDGSPAFRLRIGERN